MMSHQKKQRTPGSYKVQINSLPVAPFAGLLCGINESHDALEEEEEEQQQSIQNRTHEAHFLTKLDQRAVAQRQP